MRIARATILNRESEQTGEHSFTQNADDPNAYNITLNAETRKDRTGYYIRKLQPVASTVRSYDRKEVDPNLLSTDSVLTGHNVLSPHQPIAIEQNKKDTRIYLYAYMGGDISLSETNPLKNDSESNIFTKVGQIYILDEKTNDKYMVRAMDDNYLRFVKKVIMANDTCYVYQVCLVFPPLKKHVEVASLGVITKNGNQHLATSFAISSLPRKGRVISK